MFDASSVTVLALFALLLYISLLSIHRLYFCRISHVPGPKLAALTYFYQYYYDVYPYHGQFTFQLANLHHQYGPVIRIGPDEVHVNDIELYNEMYSSSHKRKRDKSPLWFWMANCTSAIGKSTFATLDGNLHRLRRDAIGPFFSRKNVLELQPRVSSRILALKDALLRRQGTAELVDLRDACGALTLEVITEYSFGEAIPVLDLNDFAMKWNDNFRKSARIHPIGRAFPTPMRTLMSLPNWIMSWSAEFKHNARFRRTISDLTEKAVADAEEKDEKGSKPTIMHGMLRSDVLPLEERTLPRLKSEVGLLIGAGMETTGRTLAVTMYHILANVEVYNALLEELRTVMPTSSSPTPSVPELEKLPYLTAVLNEGLRMGHGTAGRLARIAPSEDLVLNGIVIPRGVTMSQTNYLLHTNPDTFPNPLEFHPGRFMGPEAGKALRGMVPFSRGTRMCVGLNLAWAELYLTIATLISSVKMELADTTIRDATMTAEYFVGALPEDSKGIRVRVLGGM